VTQRGPAPTAHKEHKLYFFKREDIQYEDTQRIPLEERHVEEEAAGPLVVLVNILCLLDRTTCYMQISINRAFLIETNK
jgi:hypothetical protein